MKEALLILLAMSGCLLAHIFMHKAMMGKGCHSEELVALDKVKSEENK
ncbi:hypothetical protein Calkr_0098 [Caldicellulosiruptor acetigenus I77R1B]|uniref:Uncharacterized protein n=1 Tax=Caldicellulosiruptor acetigenus (strain ATCC 700853 / DSM 12137 / I77R1B) TaxID=632335 RepID=E4S602_CALA7|nr:hypothetical protein [Caldicellulosiruptor acetigenus]ADQ39675.1 hypothetical protein Calkr_0098 [Caldicellulosiruptor acetigenus I77R1B]